MTTRLLESTATLTGHNVVMQNTLKGLMSGLPALKWTHEWRAATVPSLPAELWLDIFELAIRPSIILDLEFDPGQIELAYKCLVWESHGNQRAAAKMALRASRTLGAVCSLWRSLIDQIDIVMPWVVEETRCGPAAGQPHKSVHDGFLTTDTRMFTRLNREIILNGQNFERIRYSHPLPTLSLSIVGANQEPKIALENITPFPTKLKVLSLHLNKRQVTCQILKEIEMGLSALTTLRLCLQASAIREFLEFPTVVTFFLSITHVDTNPETSSLSYIRWTFPMLRNLALTDYTKTAGKWLSIEMNTFFFETLQAHIGSIQSLRIEPMTKEIVDPTSPICWLRMKKLKALAANFSEPRIPNTSIYMKLCGWKSESVRHLIQTRTQMDNWDHGDTIRYFMGSCPHLESLSLSITSSNNPNIHKVCRVCM
jgi:hypothetical protein